MVKNFGSKTVQIAMNAVVTSHTYSSVYIVLQVRRRSARIFTPGGHPLALAARWTAETNSNSARWDHYALGN